MSGISKEAWEDIESSLSCSYVDISFKFKGYLLQVNRVRISESKTALMVWIDGKSRSSWGCAHLDFMKSNLTTDEIESTPSIIPDVWKPVARSNYKPKQIKAFEKINGKRWCKKEGIYDKTVFYTSTFSKASVLVRQFKKLDGLELITDEGAHL